jgi:transcriptional regulator with XRE-family HTH domain
MARLRAGSCLLAKRLSEAGLTQQDLADRLGMNKRQVSNYATGKIKEMSLTTAVMISDIIGCSPRDLYEWIEVPRGDKRRRGKTT